jgi:serine/threonine protein kinase
LNPDYELQAITSYLSSLSSISSDPSSRIQTLEKFESKIVPDTEFIAVTLSNQYYPNTLDDLLEAHDDSSELSEEQCLSFVYQIARCLEDLKGAKRIKFHGNLKLSNVFLDDDENVVAIGDFYIKHISNKVHEEPELYKSMINYLPPEFFTLNRDRDEFSDVWALGVILYLLSTGGIFPFVGELEDDDGDIFDEFDTKRNIVNITYDELEDRQQSQLLLEQIFTQKPHNRISIGDIIKFIDGKIDMKNMRTSMKRQTMLEQSSDDDNESDDINKKLDFLINDDQSEDDRGGKQSVVQGLNTRQTALKKGDDSVEDEDYKNLDNLVQGRVSGTTKSKKTKDFMDQLPDSYSNVESSKIDDSEMESSKEVDDSEAASEESGVSSSLASNPPVYKPKRDCIHAKNDDSINTNLDTIVKIVMLNKDKLIVFSDSEN